MNQKQQDNLAKLYYDLGKSLILACVAAAFVPHTIPGKVVWLALFCAAMLIGKAHELDGEEIENA